MLTEVIYATLMAGIPIGLITFGMFLWAYKTGSLSPEDNEIEQTSKEIASGKLESDKPKNLVLDKWVEFGGGYYGLMALLTFLHVEVIDIWGLVLELPAMNGLNDVISLGINFLIQVIIESITNFITAIMWWSYWLNLLPIDIGYVWLIVSYVGYLSGDWGAKRVME